MDDFLIKYGELCVYLWLGGCGAVLLIGCIVMLGRGTAYGSGGTSSSGIQV